MNATIHSDYKTIHVTLSRRNLEALLLKLDEPDSNRMLVRRVEDGYGLIVWAEENEDHYREGREPGLMHPREEARLTPFKREEAA